jgi:NADH-quinone oxidoreductase subunit J
LNDPRWIFTSAALVGALGMWLLLPRPEARARLVGVLLAATSLGLIASQVPGVGDWASDAVLYTLGGVTVVAAVATVTFRNPIYCAIWFGLCLLGVAGLLLLQGAQFIAAATVVVYAGAILVTFLFVLMLAQPRGRAPYDRVSWEAQTSALAGAVLVGILSTTVVSVLAGPDPLDVPAVPRSEGVLAEQHVAAIGRELFGRHLIAVEVAGALLLAALVGAAIIVGRAKGPLAPPSDDKTASEDQATDRQG